MMMSKKQLNIVLIPAVLLVWTILIFKIVEYFKSSEPEFSNTFNQEFSPESIFSADTIKLFADYRDPFISSSTENITATFDDKFKIQPVYQPSIKKVEWPNITYGGLVKNTKDENFALLTIAEKTIITAKNSTIDELKVNVIYKDSISVQLQNEVKTILKK